MAVCALAMLEEGVGDEVTLAGGVVLLALAMVLAWLSTHVAENGDHLLGSILTGGGHVSLVGLGGGDPYLGGSSGVDPAEPQPAPHSQDDKPEEEESGTGSEGGEGAPAVDEEANIDQHLNIQGMRKRAAAAATPVSAQRVAQTAEQRQGGEAGRAAEKVPTSTDADITVRLKFLNDTEELATLRPQDTVGILKSKYFSGKERQTKLIFQGRLLQDPGRTLLSLNIAHNSVVHCHISQALQEEGGHPDGEPRAGEGSVGSQGDGRGAAGARAGTGAGRETRGVGLALNMGSLVVPIFVVLLAVVWYFRINYRQFFTAPATISLVGVTIFFSFLVFGMYGR